MGYGFRDPKSKGYFVDKEAVVVTGTEFPLGKGFDVCHEMSYENQ